VPWFGLVVANLSPRTPGFDPRPVHVRFVVGKMTLIQVFIRILKRYLVGITALRSSLHIITRRTNGRSLITFQKAVLFWKLGIVW